MGGSEGFAGGDSDVGRGTTTLFGLVLFAEIHKRPKTPAGLNLNGFRGSEQRRIHIAAIEKFDQRGRRSGHKLDVIVIEEIQAIPVAGEYCEKCERRRTRPTEDAELLALQIVQ